MSAGWFRRRFLPGGLLPAPGTPRPRASPVPYRRPRFLRGSGSGPGTADASRRPDSRPVRSPARGRSLPWNAGYAEIINAEKSEFNEDQAACGKLCIRRCEFGAEEDQEWVTLCPEEDEVIGRELEASGQVGGCTALVAVSLQGKLYVANAGDSRAILVRRDEVRPLSSEFTPETERQRIQQLAFVYPELLAGEFTRLEFPRRLKGDDLGQKVLFRDHHMTGWSYKCVEKSDLKYPLIHGQGRQVSEWPHQESLLNCLLQRLGYWEHWPSRGAWETISSESWTQTFSSSPSCSLSHRLDLQVTVLDVDQLELQEEDVVVMATDGLWDVLSNEQVARLVRSFLPGNREDPHRFSELAQMLIHSTQGKDDSLTGERQVSYDDVSVFVIPLHSQGQGSSGH
ncbi:PREDICTED: protein phosphatase 1M isoform X3 [Ceratotherium simum simum]|uniref:Protein phosphatase 1M isoform X3 n=1 Tax=Ceratotherium simum simum TaxID=73337 RepID=A0ABM1D8V3_CERSS|nr:PREDICTED: protein phosphatase 1M isoform X3 [Ceratotherium simum simum]